MRRIATMLSTAVILALVAGVYAQGKPNFTGKWTRDAEKTAAANPAPAGGGGGAAGGGGGGGGRGGGGGGATFELKQDATTLTRTPIGQDGTPGNPSVYKLDGSDSKNSQPGRGGAAPTDIVSKATWAGNTISIATTRDMNGTAVTSTAVYSMDGDSLVITNTAGTGTPTKTYYKKG
jgi:hypothetical protein